VHLNGVPVSHLPFDEIISRIASAPATAPVRLLFLCTPPALLLDTLLATALALPEDGSVFESLRSRTVGEEEEDGGVTMTWGEGV